MTEVNHPTFRQSLEKNLNWIRDYWVQVTALFGVLGILLEVYTIRTYTNAIGRPDLMSGVLESPSDLVMWLVFLAVVAAAYLLILMTTSILFGLSVSLFKDSPTTQPYMAKLLFWPVLLGIAALVAVIFKGPELNDYEKLGCVVLYITVTIWALRKNSKFRLAVDLCATSAAPGNANSKAARALLLLMLVFVLVSSVVSAVFPVSLILKAYTGEDTPEAVIKLMLISIFSAGVTLIPVVVLYASKADTLKRILQCAAVTLVILVIVIGASPGGSLTIVNAAASIMKVRDQSEAKFMLTENYATEVFDSEMWGPVESVREQPVISAFPLFSFGDVLLLCPIKLIKTELKDWPEKSPYCVVTKKSTAIRLPRKSEATGQAKKSSEVEPQPNNA
ncbi:hypothetical protein ACW9HW_00900 [Pseudomonas sp. SDO5532_S415]